VYKPFCSNLIMQKIERLSFGHLLEFLMSCSVVLRDGTSSSIGLCVNVIVLQDLGVMPGDHVECFVALENVLLVRLWPKEDMPRGVAECGRVLLMSLGLGLGDSLTLRSLERPLGVARLVLVDWEGAVEGLARLWRGHAVWSGATMLASKGGRTVPVAVQVVEPAGWALVGRHTRVARFKKSSQIEQVVRAEAAESAMEQKLRRAVQGAFAGAENAAHGVILWGPPGSGKTWLVRRVFGDRLVEAASSSSFQDAVQVAKQQQPCVILIDEADKRLSPQEGGSDGADGAAFLMSALDNLEGTKIAVVVIVRRPDVLPMALRRAGRLEVELEVGQMSGAERRALLRSLLEPCGWSEWVPLELEMPGMVAGDVVAVAREVELLKKEAGMSFERVIAASKRVQTGASRGWEVEVPKAGLDEVRGMNEAKQKLAECIEWPLLHADAFARLGVKPASGILLYTRFLYVLFCCFLFFERYGPPGNGKTLLARGAASQMNCSFILVKGPELYSKFGFFWLFCFVFL
jgi:transitional endoplasmic reticulum ATPase